MKNILFKLKNLKRTLLPSKKNFKQMLINLGPTFFQVIVAILVFLFVIITYNYDLFLNLQNLVADQFLYDNKTDSDIIILAIDDQSIQKYGRWPWDRDVLAQIQNKLNESEAKTIAWNLTFFEPSDEDSQLAEAFNSDKSVILAAQINPKWQSGYIEPLDEFLTENVETGYTNIKQDPDGKIRSMPLYAFDRNNVCRKNFALIMYEQHTGRIYDDPCRNGLPDIPLKNQNELIINYAGPPETFQTISVADFMEYDTIPGAMGNKTVIVGVTARYVQDYKLTPTSSSFMSGSEINGNIFYTLKNGNFLLSENNSHIILGFLFTSVLTLLIMKFQRPLVGSIITLSLINIYVLFALWQFSNGFIMDMIYLPIAGLIGWISQVVISFYFNKRAEEYVKGAFEHYVSKKVLTDLIEDKDKLSLGGESKNMTVLFSDIRKYTTFAEKTSAKKLVNITNDYLTRMSEIILKYDGYIDKYIGDEIMAFWGAPVDNPKHAYYACLAALNMTKELEKWKKEKKMGKRIFNMGIGINTGNMIVGNIGSENKFGYTVIGDSVNIGSRIEGLTKLYKAPIIISGETYKELKKTTDLYDPKDPEDKSLIVKKLDVVKVKGREHPVKLYELVGRYKDQKKKLDSIELFEQGLKLYQQGNWNKALNAFKKIENNDPAVDEFISRIKQMKKEKPKGWLGIWEIHTK